MGCVTSNVKLPSDNQDDENKQFNIADFVSERSNNIN